MPNSIELNPVNLWVMYYSRGNAYNFLKSYDKAIEDWEKAIELNPELESELKLHIDEANDKLPGKQQKKTKQYKHEGFFARGTLGFGSTSISETVQNDKIDISGFSGDMNIQIGYSVTENLQLFGVAGYNSITEPKYKINGVEATTTTSSEVSLFRYGAGATYYFMPYNAFITFDITSGQNEIEVDNVSSKSDHGVVFNFGAGKEWWVSKDWGLGAMFYFYTGTIKDATVNGITPKIKNTGFGIAFTATYN